MIIDKLENSHMYNFAEAWRIAFEFLGSLTPDSEDKKYTIQGDDIFAIVMSYKTTQPQTAILESHREYVDIQSVIVGGECFECSFRETLSVDVPYDKSKDVELYRRTAPGHTRVNVMPGTFVMLYPHDAHMAGLMIDDKEEVVKKVVVKIRAELLK
jgi:YhcH/YjgK/YiaL family protein